MTAGEPHRLETPDGLTLAAARHRADGPTKGAVLLAHGLAQDMDEGGMFVRLADRLTEAGFDAVRFTYRGHGDSDGDPSGVTVAGERLDFETAFEYVTAECPGPYFVVAKSFGAVSTCLSLDRFGDDLSGVVLWNPVLDVDGTFLDPTLPWGVRNFTGEQLAELRATGTLSVDGRFEIGRVLYDELRRYDPDDRLGESSLPALVIHGDADEIVPYEDARRVAMQHGADFHTIEGAGHGFVTPGEPTPGRDADREQDRRTVAWIDERVDP
ncbi:alpha/beta hydrolase [Natronoarchaeum rubrum]|uniref:alpha/beta hydrolase n=1 Tax=Natronoarchaeum rubrum TaxID=755311 RepID=UPI00211239A3|nr:alpha/beta hydrolase [Natronoarchaeum rubrum]